MLLPFMLISGVFVRKVNKLSSQNGKSKSLMALFITFFLGIFCGYPLGAKTCSDFVQKKIYSKTLGNIILPLCNNSSPMFISGYIVYGILQDSISFFTVILCIYAPYILVTTVEIIIFFIKYYKKDNLNQSDNINKFQKEEPNLYEYLINTINQITFVGICIMFCSIITEFIIHIPYIEAPFSSYLSGITEITRGTMDIKNDILISEKIKTALIIAMTSFGGISSIFQTKIVIDKSGLSIIYYTAIKAICAILTMGICILLI